MLYANIRFMSKTTRDILIIVVTTLLITYLIWLPHLIAIPNLYGLDFSNGFSSIYRNFDGLEYVVIAKTLYNPDLIAKIPQPLPAIYYGSHFPGYALLILIFSPLMGFLKSMLFVSILFTILAAMAFYFLLKDFSFTSQPLWLSLLFLILPARWLVVHSVGSSEPIFIFFIITSIYFFLKFEQTNTNKFIWLSALFGSLAQITRPPGVLLLISYAAYILWKIFHNKEGSFFKKYISAKLIYFPLVLMLLSLVGIFYWFSVSYGDFWAYFRTGDNIHLTLPPFQVFNKDQFWVGDIWLEDIVYTYILSFLGGLLLIKRKLYPLAFFVLVYSLASISIAHRDISRYLVPISPFILIAFEKVITTKEFKIVLAILALGIYLYAQNFILNNIAPIPDLKVFN